MGRKYCAIDAAIAFALSLSLSLSIGRRPNGFLGLSVNDRTILFLAILLGKTVSVG